MYNDYTITMDSFGDTCPANWEEIADYLNALIDEIPDDEDKRDKVDALWEVFCSGDLPDAPKPSAEMWEA